MTIACDDRMVVCDRGDNAVKVLSPEGTELLQSFRAPDCDGSPYVKLYVIKTCSMSPIAQLTA